MTVNFMKADPRAQLPRYQTSGSAGCDLCACLDAPVEIPAGGLLTVSLGFAAEIPPGYAGFIFSRSGLGGTHGVVVAQGVGVIDSDYRGVWVVPLRNLSGESYTVSPGERVAQAVFLPVEAAVFREVTELSQTQRGLGGFGSTGRS